MAPSGLKRESIGKRQQISQYIRLELDILVFFLLVICVFKILFWVSGSIGLASYIIWENCISPIPSLTILSPICTCKISTLITIICHKNWLRELIKDQSFSCLVITWLILITLSGYFEVISHLIMIETVSLQNLWVGTLPTMHQTRHANDFVNAKSHAREKPLLARNWVGCCPWMLQQGLINFKPWNFQLYNKSLKDWSLGKQLMLFPKNLSVSRSGCFPRI